MRSARRPARVRVLGGEVDLVTPRELLDFIDEAARARRGAVIANHNAHSLFLIRRSPELRRFFDAADLIQVDSRPLIAWARLVGLPLTTAMRSTYLDWREAFWSRAEERAWRVFYLGGAPGVARAAADRLAPRLTRAAIATHHGYFDKAAGSAENEAAIAAVAEFDPHILMVGMGMPEQELWTLRNAASLTRRVVLTVGAAFDYEAGAQPTPPRWTGRLGVEWLARLALQPRRLAFRYLVEPWSLVGPALADIGAALDRRRSV